MDNLFALFIFAFLSNVLSLEIANFRVPRYIFILSSSGSGQALALAHSGSLRLSQALSGSYLVTLTLRPKPGANTKFGLPPTHHHQ